MLNLDDNADADVDACCALSRTSHVPMLPHP